MDLTRATIGDDSWRRLHRIKRELTRQRRRILTYISTRCCVRRGTYGGDPPINYDMQVTQDGVLEMRVDLNQQHGPSMSGRSAVVGRTGSMIFLKEWGWPDVFVLAFVGRQLPYRDIIGRDLLMRLQGDISNIEAELAKLDGLDPPPPRRRYPPHHRGSRAGKIVTAEHVREMTLPYFVSISDAQRDAAWEYRRWAREQISLDLMKYPEGDPECEALRAGLLEEFEMLGEVFCETCKPLRQSKGFTPMTTDEGWIQDEGGDCRLVSVEPARGLPPPLPTSTTSTIQMPESRLHAYGGKKPSARGRHAMQSSIDKAERQAHAEDAKKEREKREQEFSRDA